MIYVAFYKGRNKWYDGLIKWWTRGPYTHCEIIVNDTKKGIIEKIGITENDKVRKKKLSLDEIHNEFQNWSLLELKLTPYEEMELTSKINNFFNETKGFEYDWVGIILGNIFNKRQGHPNKYTCSEWVCECLDRFYDFIFPKYYQSISPNDLYDILKTKKLIIE